MRRPGSFLQQLLTVMADEQHFFFSEGTMCGHADDETLARVTEGVYVILQPHAVKCLSNTDV